MHNDYIYRIEDDQIVFSCDFNRYVKTYYYCSPMSNGQVCKKNEHGSDLPIPPNITRMKFNDCFNQKICVPSSIKSLTFGVHFNCEFILGPCLNTLRFGVYFNRPIQLNSDLRTVSFGNRFNSAVILNRDLRVLHLGHNYNKPIQPNPKLESLVFGYDFNKFIMLNSQMKMLTFGDEFNQPIKLNSRLVFLSFGLFYEQHVVLSKKLIRLELNRRGPSLSMPKFLKYSTLSYNVYSTAIMNKRLQALSICINKGYTFYLRLENVDDVVGEGFDIQIHKCDVHVTGSYIVSAYIIDNFSNSIKHVVICKKSNLTLDNLPNSMCVNTHRNEYGNKPKYNITNIYTENIEYNFAHLVCGTPLFYTMDFL